MFFKLKESTNFSDLSLDEVKRFTRILFIDDESRNDIIDYLKKENWHSRHIEDIESLENVELKDAHIICVDIKGVGKKLKKENEGLDIVVSIKKKYPQKKVILYSSQAHHDIFHDANSIIDKRIYKSSGDMEVFRSAIEELSLDCFNWKNVVSYAYTLVRSQLPSGITFDIFENGLRKVSKNKSSLTPESINKTIAVGANIAQILSLILQLFANKGN